MNILALIPARAGSKGIPNKNLTRFCGEPLILPTIDVAEEAMRAGLVSRIVCSTDSCKILMEHPVYEGSIAMLSRPEELATDESPVIDTVRHALDCLGGRILCEMLPRWEMQREPAEFDAVLLLQPTNPLRNLDDIRGAIALLEAHPEADSVISHIPARCHPARMRHAGGQKYAWKLPTSEETQGTPRQQLPPIIQRTGEIYLTRTKQIREGNDMEGTFCVPWMQDPARAWDIDEPVDLVIAEALWKAANQRGLESGTR